MGNCDRFPGEDGTGLGAPAAPVSAGGIAAFTVISVGAMIVEPGGSRRYDDPSGGLLVSVTVTGMTTAGALSCWWRHRW